ncbi:U2 small nuclear ribonucleoprotein A', putative [Plasmodium sp. gorilla clade G2]|uniref:U2 small nuclear ribonucleoprotein A', putative n=1 Tax=Plasmodium sp. gorilla clade G2 TaxID=880535 RepID=UPI000D1FF5D3|nr:U2 small nuclear ribonucleoprotein A', putative [Plasmodium sp. gorilla clade G2]SOV18516.1 U2 small nuclear ribonucleoprotein A', putative [Plasmodium sp. gorilla clade G2]
MRITIDMINEAEQSRNPVLENTISLRGNKISVIENLSITKDYFECIDLSDNEIIKLNNIPYLKKLKTLILCNNKIARIDGDIFDNLPNLNSLVLTNNKLEKLSDLKSLFKAKNLIRLSLLENSVCKLEHYREYLIYNIPSLRYLDFEKIKTKDRELANVTMENFNEDDNENEESS